MRSNDDDDAIPDEDASEVTKLFNERLQAWKHACGYLEDYIQAQEKMQNAHGKEYEKVVKTVSNPLKESHHFDQNVGGVAELFENLRANTQAVSNSHHETAKILKGSVLPIFTRLHAEIKNKNKELTKGAGKSSKAVDKARTVTQKHIELLGQNTASFDSTGGKTDAANDPYILQRGIYHRLNKQIQEENNNKRDMLSVQSAFSSFEAHVLNTIQQGLVQLVQVLNQQSDNQKTLYTDTLTTAQQIAPDFEWNGFVQRNNNILIDPNAPDRNVRSISFPNQDHKATQPMIAGSLERKGKMLKKYETGYYVVSQSKFLHEFKTDDDFQRDPVPENSLYLPDCAVGALDGTKFNVKGKDVSKGKLGNNFSMNHELQFKAHTAADAAKWWEIIRRCAGQLTEERPDVSEPNSPVDGGKRVGSGLSQVEQPSRTGTMETQASAGATGESMEAREAREAAEDRQAAVSGAGTNAGQQV
ncbi:PH domain-containing protein [Viridothelium virens]|uniref:PH domain-containing protein n=1 Tax=Viridothelium virens TaxID=1048519 RepID=A0A6A6HN76_VIRVR|nr:PH domain-containing protein [Viridothelium virens]